MNKILFPTDFSKTADNAFLYALTLAEKMDASLTLLHVYELPELGRSLKTTTKEVYEMMEMEALEDFKKSVKKLRGLAEEKGLNHISFSHQMEEGETVSVVAHVAKQLEVDLIVMGTKGATGLQEIFLGSVATGVIDESEKPVLTIPDKASYKDTIDKVAYLSNYKDEEAAAFREVYTFAGLFNAQVLCVHYDGEQQVENKHRDEWRAKITDETKNIDFNVITGTSFEEALVKFNKDAQIDILAVQPRKKNVFARLFSTSVSKTIAHHLNIPLLTLPKK